MDSLRRPLSSDREIWLSGHFFYFSILLYFEVLVGRLSARLGLLSSHFWHLPRGVTQWERNCTSGT